MTPIESLNAYLAANPTEKAWVEEVLIRGAAGDGAGWGINKGAHFILCFTQTGPLGTDIKRTPPLPAAMVDEASLNATPLADVLSLSLVQMQNAVDALEAEKATLTTQLAAANVRIAELEQEAP